MTNRFSDGIKLSQLRALVAVAAQQNFSEAALHLGVTQSAISHAIASLENELGVVLLNRGRHGARVTPVGQEIVDRAHQVLQMIDDISKTANFAKGLDRGQVRVGSFRSVATHILPVAIAQFRKRFPGIAVTIEEHEDYDGVEQALRDGEIDAGFTYLPAPAELEAWELIRDEFIVLLPPQADQTEVITWEQLAQYPIIMYPEQDGSSRQLVNHFHQHGQTLKVAYRVREDSTTVRMVQQGLGATVMPRLAAEPVPSDVPIARIIGIAVLANGLHPPAVFAFLDFLKEHQHQPDEMPQKA